MMKTCVTLKKPAAVGPYCHANVSGGFAFISGQLGLDPETGKLENGVEAQTERALKNLSAVLEACGSGLKDVVKTTVFVADMGDFSAINAVYQRYFTENFPARSCFQVAALPCGGLVEIEAIAAATK